MKHNVFLWFPMISVLNFALMFDRCLHGSLHRKGISGSVGGYTPWVVWVCIGSILRSGFFETCVDAVFDVFHVCDFMCTSQVRLRPGTCFGYYLILDTCLRFPQWFPLTGNVSVFRSRGQPCRPYQTQGWALFIIQMICYHTNTMVVWMKRARLSRKTKTSLPGTQQGRTQNVGRETVFPKRGQNQFWNSYEWRHWPN